MDEIVQRFVKESHPQSLIDEATKLAQGTYKDDPKAAMYVKIMKKVKEKGEAYVGSETARVDKLLKGQMHEEKRKEFDSKARVLTVFGASRDEL